MLLLSCIFSFYYFWGGVFVLLVGFSGFGILWILRMYYVDY